MAQHVDPPVSGRKWINCLVLATRTAPAPCSTTTVVRRHGELTKRTNGRNEKSRLLLKTANSLNFRLTGKPVSSM